MANGRTLGDDIMWLYDDIKQMIICNVFSDHPVRLNPTYWVIKIPNRRSHVPFFLLQGLVLSALVIVDIHWGKRRQTLQTLVDPPITCCACISSPWGGSIDVRKRVKALRGRELEDYTPVTSQPIYLAEWGGKWKKYIYLKKRNWFFQSRRRFNLCKNYTPTHKPLFFF